METTKSSLPVTSDSSNDDSNSSTDAPPEKQSEASDSRSKLPNPFSENRLGSKGSVFHNAFKTAEQSKNAILEQHVKMTSTERQKTLDGKKVCWTYRKLGRCNKGHKCKYAHDNDILATNNQAAAAPAGNCTKAISPAATEQSHLPQEPVVNDGDSYMAQSNRKKRSGVTNTLHPPKKVSKLLQKERQQERPWTLGKS